MTYIMLLVFPDGERYWSHWNVKNLAEETLKLHTDSGAVGTIIETENFEEKDCIF
jgi:hypothetical protein